MASKLCDKPDILNFFTWNKKDFICFDGVHKSAVCGDFDTVFGNVMKQQTEKFSKKQVSLLTDMKDSSVS